MPTFTREWLANYERRHEPPCDEQGGREGQAAPGEEDQLHLAIIDYCDRRGWCYFHGSTAHRTHRTKGEPDFTIFFPGGRSLLVECKTRKGKLSEEQIALRAVLRVLGHEVVVVRSLAEFQAATRDQVSSRFARC